MRLGQVQILSRTMMPLLIVQFLLGMFANLFVTFSTSTDPNPLAVVFTGGSPALMPLHRSSTQSSRRKQGSIPVILTTANQHMRQPVSPRVGLEGENRSET